MVGVEKRDYQPHAALLPGSRPTAAVPFAVSRAENDESPAARGFRECAEADSNLHPVIPDQAAIQTASSVSACANRSSSSSACVRVKTSGGLILMTLWSGPSVLSSTRRERTRSTM